MVSSSRGVHACGISAHPRAKRIPMGQGIVQPVTLGLNWPGTDWSRPRSPGTQLVPYLILRNVASGGDETDPKRFKAPKYFLGSLLVGSAEI